MSIIEEHFSRPGHQCLIYADDLVIFSSNKSFNLATEYLNSALKDLKSFLIKVSLKVTPDK